MTAATKQRLPLKVAEKLAEKIRAALLPACERVEVAGSIRRGKATVGDVELLATPKSGEGLFGDDPRQPTKLDLLIGQLERQGKFVDAWHAKDRGLPFRDGPRWKTRPLRAVEGVVLDLFTTTPEQWGVMLMIRTGPGEFSKRVVTNKGRSDGWGFLPDCLIINDGRVWRRITKAGNVIRDVPMHTPEESDVFALLGMEYIEPAEREQYCTGPSR